MESEPSLIRWFRADASSSAGLQRQPLYTVERDAKKGVSLVQADHRVAPSWRERLHFSVSRATLSLAAVTSKDDGLYLCQVQFPAARERTSNVRLLVVEPPDSPVLKTEPDSGNGTRLREGQRLRVLCQVHGGKPRPTLQWRMALADGSASSRLESSEGSTSAKDDMTRSWATLARLDRSHHDAVLSCDAVNSELVPARTATLRLQLEMTPAQVRIKGSRSPVSADVEAVVECETTGSQPAADVSWSLENVALRDAQVLARGANGTASLLRWTPRPEDDGRRLICRAVNNRFPQDVIEDVWLLDVHCGIVLADKPRTELRLGSGLDPWGVQEGHDVYFECSVQANPAVHEVSWSLDGRRLTGARLIVSNLSLALRQVTRHQAGQYRCAAHNSAGHAVSNAVPLRVKHAPVCEREDNALFLAALDQEVDLPCNMLAEPPQVAFSWTLNGSLGRRDLGNFQSAGLRSTLKFRPRSEADYGMLECSASNSVGVATRPCVFHLLRPPGNAWLSQTWYNCSVWNATSSAVQVVCQRGALPVTADRDASAGNDQSEDEPRLTLELLRPPTAGANASRASATWSRAQAGRRSLWLRGLAPDSPLELLVFADSARGRSQLAALRAHTLPEVQSTSSEHAQERRTQQRLLPEKTRESLPKASEEPSCCPPFVTLACAVTAAILVALPAAVLIGIRLRARHRLANLRCDEPETQKSDGSPSPKPGRRRRSAEIYLPEVK